MEIHTTDSEDRYYNDLWHCLDSENVGKISAQKANLLFNSSSNASKDKIDLSKVCLAIAI